MKVVHKAKYVNQNGGASALCFRFPRPIDLRWDTWTLIDEDVTCDACIAKMGGAKVQ